MNILLVGYYLLKTALILIGGVIDLFVCWYFVVGFVALTNVDGSTNYVADLIFGPKGEFVLKTLVALAVGAVLILLGFTI